jgi:hypothetical protein
MAVTPPPLRGAFKLLTAVAMVLIIVCCVEGEAIYWGLFPKKHYLLEANNR